MATIFGQALAALQGFFTRGFWFGSFLPVALFAASNILIGYLTLPIWFKSFLDDIKTGTWFWSVPIAAGMIVLAYALAPLVPLCRAVLDGRLLPDGLFERLRAEPLIEKDRLDIALDSASESLAQIELLNNGLAQESLDQANIDAQAAPLPATLTGSKDAALQSVSGIEVRLDKKLSVSSDELWDMLDHVAAALRENTVTEDERLHLVNRCLDVLPKAVLLAEARVQRLQERLETWPNEVKATEIANVRHLSELYSQRVYGVGFGYLWPRVQMVIPDNDPVLKQIESARALLEFSVLSLMLTVLLLVIWLPMLALEAPNPWGFLILGAIGPVGMWFFYRLVVAAQAGLGELVQVVVDRFRFDVLKMLHIKAPPTLAAERELWSLLGTVATRPTPDADLTWTLRP